MNVDLDGVAAIWLHLLLPTHWPILVAAIGTLVYARTLSNRDRFFIATWILGYGVQGVMLVPWPLIWMTYFDKQRAPDQFAVFFILYGMSAVSALLTLVAIRIIATKYWGRLYPSSGP